MNPSLTATRVQGGWHVYNDQGERVDKIFVITPDNAEHALPLAVAAASKTGGSILFKAGRYKLKAQGKERVRG